MYITVIIYIYNPSRLPQPRSALRIPAPVAPLPSQPWISQNFCKGFLLQRPCEICSCRRNGTQRWASCNFSIVICDILCVPLRTIMSVSIIFIENQRRESARSRAREERERAGDERFVTSVGVAWCPIQDISSNTSQMGSISHAVICNSALNWGVTDQLKLVLSVLISIPYSCGPLGTGTAWVLIPCLLLTDCKGLKSNQLIPIRNCKA